MSRSFGSTVPSRRSGGESVRFFRDAAPNFVCALMSGSGLGRVKTPTCNLRVEIPSRFRQLENQKYLRPLLGEDDRENNSAHSRLVHVFTQPGSFPDVARRTCDACFTPMSRHRQLGRLRSKSAMNGNRPFHSITSSAVVSSDGGMVRPSVFAVFRLMTNSNFVGCTTGRSAGFSPLRIRPA